MKTLFYAGRRELRVVFLRLFLFIAVVMGMVFLGRASIAQTADSGKDVASYLDPNFASSANLPITDTISTAFGIIEAFLQLLGLIGLVLIIYGGFTLLFSAGNPEKVKKGRDIVLWAIIGIAVVLSSYGILLYIDSITSQF